MPWSAKDAKKHKKGLTPAQSRKWSKVANAVLDDSGDEGKAIRIANSKVGESLTVFEELENELDYEDDEERGDRLYSEAPNFSYKVSIEAKELGSFSNLGSAVEAIVKYGRDFKLPLRWDSDSEFMSGKGMVQIFLDGPQGEEPLVDEDKEDIEFLIASELDIDPDDEDEW